MAWALVGPGGCGDDAVPTEPVAPIGGRLPAEPSAPPMAAKAYPARRCGECHGKTTETWMDSAHARADTSPTYRAMRKASGRDDCDRCHAPLRALFPGDEALAGEGVTCDVCHTLTAVSLRPRETMLQLDVGSPVRYGPLCYAKDHYFHRMGCLPLYSSSDLCGGCHLWTTHTTAVDELPVLSTYTDWKAGPYAEADQTCQGCHMAAKAGEVAVGWGTRTSASDHGMFGPEQELRGRALDVGVKVRTVGDEVVVRLDLSNSGAGHHIPAGLAGRRIIVEVVAVGADGEPLERQERVYGRILVDEAGQEVPFYAAHHVARDTRIAPQEVRREQLAFPAAGVAQVRVQAFDHMISAAIAEAIGVAPPEPTPLADVQAVLQGQSRWDVRAP